MGECLGKGTREAYFAYKLRFMLRNTGPVHFCIDDGMFNSLIGVTQHNEHVKPTGFGFFQVCAANFNDEL